MRGRSETDAHDPLVIDSRTLHRQPGSAASRDIRVSAPSAIGDEVAHFVAGEQIALDVLLESVMDGVLASVTGVGSVAGECVRCLTPLTWDQEFSFRQFFAYPGAEPDLEETDDVDVMRGELMDLRPAFHDAALLALPFTPLCRQDCPGLCAECGFRMADDPDHRHVSADTRWSSLADWPGSEPPAKESD